jgi:histidinol-phosphate aminotransferase
VSHANFILAHFDSQTEAENCDNYLQTQGLVVRRVAGYKLPNALRISIGEESACRLVLGAIKKFKAGKK